MLNFFIQQQIRKYDTVEKTVKNIYQSIDNKAKVKNYFEANKKKIQKRSQECYINLSEDEKIRKK